MSTQSIFSLRNFILLRFLVRPRKRSKRRRNFVKSTNIEINKEILSKFPSWAADHFFTAPKCMVVQALAELVRLNYILPFGFL